MTTVSDSVAAWRIIDGEVHSGPEEGDLEIGTTERHGVSGAQAVSHDFVEHVRALPLLSGLPKRDIAAIATAFAEFYADDGERIVGVGTRGIGLVLIVEGQAALRIDGEERTRFGPGDFVGEVSALLDVPVFGDVFALGSVRYLRLPAEDVEHFLRAHSAICYRLLQAEARRLRDPRRWYSSAPARLADPDWTPSSWRSKPLLQQPSYPNDDEVEAVAKTLAAEAPLVFAGEARGLRDALAEVAAGQAFLLQAGDCAESFDERSAEIVRNRLRVMLQMAVILTYGAGVRVIKVGRMAGQFAKPRSSPTELVRDVEMPSFRGHIVNGEQPDCAARTPDPQRMIAAYNKSAARLNLVRALASGGFAGLHQVHSWNQEFVASSPEGRRYETLASEIQRAIVFMRAAGVDTGALDQTEFFTSHEALLLPYEEALTRRDSSTGDYYDCSAHMLWIGERTRQPDGAHVEFLSGVQNPIGCKIGPSATPDDVVVLCERLNPERIPGRLTLISRMGATQVTDRLPPLLAAVHEAGHPMIWACDPMHGNTSTTSGGRKTRNFDTILEEIEGFFAACAAELTWPGGIHVELTGEDVTECTGGGDGLTEDDLELHYMTTCDPRLNARQSLDLAFRVSELLRA
jgi:3-deoxy-7-phosphoheptulonate synthase